MLVGLSAKSGAAARLDAYRFGKVPDKVIVHVRSPAVAAVHLVKGAHLKRPVVQCKTAERRLRSQTHQRDVWTCIPLNFDVLFTVND